MKGYDAIIIGFGKGGKTLAAELAERGWSVAMVERSNMMYGGTCINIGCIPTKTLIHKANLAAECGHMTFDQQKAYYKQAIEEKNALTAKLRDKNFHKLADNDRITVYTGEGSFVSRDTVAVKTEDETIEIKGRHIVINTGAETVIPPIPGVGGSSKVYTSTSILELDSLPPRLVIVGGGYIGLEFASMYAGFGSQVTVLEGFSELIPREDRDIAESVKEVLEKRGIAFHLNAKVQAIRDTPGGATVSVANTQDEREYEVEADAVLLATGRRLYTQGLNLEAAGVRTDERGAIIVDDRLHTTAPHIYAVGDVKGGLQFTYISLDDYRIVREELVGQGDRSTENRGPVPYSVFIEPPLSRVGMSEAEAFKAGIGIRINRIPVASIPRAGTLGTAEGLLKAVIDAKTDRILGCTFFGPASQEVINTVALAMKYGITARELSNTVYTHPSMTESLNDLFA
ncbi:MAG: FAD-dependent oxidoreductase [Rikenellaceae bacterium]|nr:FAD-dependent oxidoreductase [Rikenellaceae bacterium]MCC8063319.1 FAD-dependent oxidoreductase [Rikenellaceae bacterium]